MHEILTSNQLTGIYGHSPLKKKKPPADIKLTRGFIVYLEIFGIAQKGGIFARTFYKDFANDDPQNQRDFETEVATAGLAGDIYKLTTTAPGAPKEPWPKVLENQISEIHFGWKPCRVSYVLNSRFAEFIVPPDALHQPETEEERWAQNLVQPVIFRRDKVIIDDSGKARIDRYRPNHTFYNLEVGVVDKAESCEVIRFDNFMLLNEQGTSLGKEPSDIQQRNAKHYKYCMDAHIRVEQTKLTKVLEAADLPNGAKQIDDVEIVDASSIKGGIVIVFDPPQGNGGGSGPP